MTVPFRRRDSAYPTLSPGASDGVEHTPPVNPAEIRLAAMNLLARREHSLGELRCKLRRRFPDEQVLDAELENLAQENLQSDERFAEGFARQRSGRGYGPLRVRHEMREKGLSDTAVDRAFKVAGIDWHALAAQALRKKFGAADCIDIREKSRRVRFMQYRGFSAEHYQSLLDE